MISSKKLTVPVVTGNHSMNWMELSEADDLASAITVDVFLGFSTHKMTDMKLRIPERIKKKLRNVLVDFQKQKCYETAYSMLTSDFNIVKPSWRSDIRFRNHIYRYLLLFDDRSGIEIHPCYRYASEGHVGAAVFATKAWPKGSRITTLVGCIAELNRSEETTFLKHHKNDFSVMYSSRKNCSQLWLGPASYVNHDCQPNCEFTINCDIDARMSLEAKIDIKNGDEIFIFYGNHFFDVNNSACECFTCELLGRGYFSKFEAVNPASLSSTVNQNVNCDSSATTTNHGDDPFSCGSVHNTGNDSENRTINNHRTASTNSVLSNVPVLRKGSSTGLARRSLASPYSLRHTGSRLNRVKARIMASTTTLQTYRHTNVFPNVRECKRNIPENTRLTEQPNAQTNRQVPCAIVKNNASVRRSLRLCYSVPVSMASLCDTGSLPSPSVSSSHISPSKCSEDPAVAPSNSLSSSPIPPQLERMSLESCDILSAGTNTTAELYNQNPTDSNSTSIQQTESLSTWQFDNQSPSREGSLSSWCNTLPCSLSPGASSATSPACAIEPILGRLWSESQPGNLSSSSKSTSNSSPPLLTRQHTGVQLPDLYGNTSPSPRTLVTVLPEQSTPPFLQIVDACKAKAPQVSPTVPVYDSFAAIASAGMLDGCDKATDHNPVIPPPSSVVLDCSPPNLTPVSLVRSCRLPDGKIGIFRSTTQTCQGCATNGNSADTHDQPKGLYCDTIFDHHLVPNEASEQVNQGADYTASPPELRTPLRTKTSLNYMLTEHDYARPALLPSLRFSRYQTSAAGKLAKLRDCNFVPPFTKTSPFKLPALAVHTTFNTVVSIAHHSPSPPNLQPATSPKTPPLVSPSIRNISDCRTSTLFSVLREPSVYPVGHPVDSPNSGNALSTHCLWPPVNMANRSACAVKRPLIITLKRVGPEHYQISRPNRVILP